MKYRISSLLSFSHWQYHEYVSQRKKNSFRKCPQLILLLPDISDSRKLLPTRYGDLMEYPGKVETKLPEKREVSVMQRSYGLSKEEMKDSRCRTRLPL
ncbi:hypothetical protein PoB_006151000 [Plakobranchus ocellatus]|uniref:Uncharacterized protein n=1 Tax=Plakobranchus ocellatus TaxID=259542 RepID=A0AAV4CT23_9GAST|nr:hypothetical protein PoB_006151000 [Plakobranchus ocellatus]